MTCGAHFMPLKADSYDQDNRDLMADTPWRAECLKLYEPILWEDFEITKVPRMMSKMTYNSLFFDDNIPVSATLKWYGPQVFLVPKRVAATLITLDGTIKSNKLSQLLPLLSLLVIRLTCRDSSDFSSVT